MKRFLNKETLLYFTFGIGTTVINYVVFYLCYHLAQMTSTLANTVAFVAAVIFAYVTNKLFVFESKSWKPHILMPELLQFLGTRLFSFLVEEAGLFVSDNLLKLGRFELLKLGGLTLDGVMAAKLLLAVFVVIVNYIFCRLIFKKNK